MRDRVILLFLALVIFAATAWLVRNPPASMTLTQDASCLRRGALGTPAIMVAEGVALGIYGWAYDRAGVREIQVRVDGKIVGKGALSEARPDVVAALGACRADARSGFAFTVSTGPAPVASRRYDVVAVTTLGEIYPIGATTLRFDHPVGFVDSTEPIRWNGANSISGWAVARGGSVQVSLRAGESELLRTKAQLPHVEVGNLYPDWPAAKTAAFEFSLSMRKLPRGRYPLTVRFEGPDGSHHEVAGPEVWNDEALGLVRSVADRLANPTDISLEAWVFSEDGVSSAAIETEDGVALGKMKLVRPRIALNDFERVGAQRKSAATKVGAVFAAQASTASLPPGLHRLIVRAFDGKQSAAVFPGPLVRVGAAPREPCNGPKRRFYYPGNHKAFQNGFPMLRSWRDLAGSGCLEIGLRGRVEYLRTTLGRARDYVFDPDFPDAGRARNGREMTGISLRALLNLAQALGGPLLITLDGGVWASSAFSAPEIDVVDMLMADERTVQWNQFGKAEAKNALGGLAASFDGPELSRMMSLNRFNMPFLNYKKRNLQAAVQEIVRFTRAHPEIDVTINLDPDLYINPWFYLTQWYDYNPDTLRQFREWLFHLGPYADGGRLAHARAEPRLSLQESIRLSGKAFASIDEVEPPRGVIDYADPWQQLWSHFRRHLVAQHYADLADWVVEAGLPASHVYTSQTFILPDVSVGVRGRATNWTDQAGVSIEGAKPMHGHLGTILYGPGSRNIGQPRSGRSLIDNIRATDPEWGVGEFHPAVIAQPDKLPTQEEAYQTLLAIVNGGARFMSPMWGSRADDQKLRPEKFRAYDSMEGTAFEYQLGWWILRLQRLPADNLVFPFGNARVDSLDGWTGGKGSEVKANRGLLRLGGDSVRLDSPLWDGLRTNQRLTVEASGSWPQRQVKAEIRLKSGGRLSCAASAAPLHCTLPTRPGDQVEQARLDWDGSKGDADVSLDEIRLELR